MRFLGVILVIIGFLRFVSVENKTTAQDFDRRAMLENIGNRIIMPYYADFLAQTEILQNAAYAFRDTPSPATLSTLRDEWKNASLAWQYCKLFNFSRLPVYHSPIEKPMDTPLNIDFIEQTILGDEVIDEPFIEGSGSNVRGLPALEYLLFAFEEEVLFEQFTNPRRMDYLVAVAENIHHKATQVYTYWSPEGNNFLGTFIDSDGDGSKVLESVSMLTNQIASQSEHIVQMRLGLPLGKSSGGTAQPELVEGRLSETATMQIIALLEGIQQTFNGGEGLGLDDYLDFLGAEYEGQALSERISQQLDLLRDRLTALESPLEIAIVEQPSELESVYTEARELIRFIKTDMAAQLGVTITFNDNDGD